MKSIIKEWLENVPKEMSVVQENLHYMGYEIFIQNKRVCIKSLQSN